MVLPPLNAPRQDVSSRLNTNTDETLFRNNTSKKCSILSIRDTARSQTFLEIIIKVKPHVDQMRTVATQKLQSGPGQLIIDMIPPVH